MQQSFDNNESTNKLDIINSIMYFILKKTVDIILIFENKNIDKRKRKF